MELQLDSDGVRLRATLATPATAGQTRGLVLCHAPLAAGASASDSSYDDLANSLAAATGWTVLTFDFRPASAGAPALTAWLNDLRVAVAHIRGLESVAGVWIAGFSVAGALALCLAGEDETIRGVATFGAPAEFDDWVVDAGTTRPLQSISKIPPRQVLLVHGDADEIVNLADARALADAAGGEVELRMLTGGGHGLRHDPRAIAVLEGWLDRQVV
jgi:uncharacterized protein